MRRSTSRTQATRTFAHNPAHRGYVVVYRENAVNHCPGCGRTHWYVGRATAECGFCATALPLASATAQGAAAPVHWRSQVLAA